MSTRMVLNGWIRLGIVLSAAWIALAGYLAYADISTLYDRKKYEVEKKGIGSATFVFSSSQSDTEIQTLITDDLIPLFEKNPERFKNREVSDPYDAYIRKHSGREVMSKIALAVVPVVVLFGIGWSVAWVRHGFRGQRNA